MPNKKQYACQTGWAAVNVQCPFWKGEQSRVIVCEGLGPGEKIERVLPSSGRKKLEMQTYCCKCYESCRIFKMLLAGYK